MTALKHVHVPFAMQSSLSECRKSFELAVYLDNRYLSADDAEFVTFITADIATYLQHATLERVLLFPPVTSYHRLLIHKTVEDFQGLASFSVGEGNNRRTVICLALSLLRGELGQELMSQPPEPHVRKGRGRGRGTTRGSPSPSGLFQRENKSRPGATADSLTQEVAVSATKEKKSLGTRFPRERKKPEQQIYVPRARRLHQQGESSEAEVNGAPPSHAEGRLHKEQDESSTGCSGRESLGSPSEQRRTKSSRRGRPEMQRYVPRARRQQLSDSPAERSVVPESWDDAVDSSTEIASVHGNVESPKGSSVKKFKSESEDEKSGSVDMSHGQSEETRTFPGRKHSLEKPDNQSGSEVVSDMSHENVLSKVSQMDSVPSSAHTVPSSVPELVQSSLEEHCSASDTSAERVGQSVDSAHSVPVSTSDVQDTQNDNSSLKSNQESLLLSVQNSDTTISQQAKLSSQHTECQEINPGLIPPDPSGGSTQPEDLSTQSPVVMKDDSSPDVVSAIPGTSVDSCVKSNTESRSRSPDPQPLLETGSVSGVRTDYTVDHSPMLTETSVSGRLSLNDNLPDTESSVNIDRNLSLGDNLPDKPISHNTNKQPDTGKSVDGAAVSGLNDEQVTAVVEGNDHSEEKMEESSSQEAANMDQVKMDVHSSWSAISDDQHVKTGPELEGNDLNAPNNESTQDSTNDIVKDNLGKALSSEEQDELESLELEKKLKAKAIAALDFSEPKTDSQEEEEEDSWDKLFDDNGDCLDPSIIEELTSHVGKVQIDKPKINYLNFQPKEPDMDMELYGHVIEIYDFPSEFLTRDLIGAFKDFMSRGFDIKWVDDTHALGVFASTIAAQDALRLNHPLLKVRSLTEASRQSKTKAKKNHEFLQPYKARPETSASAARRLVSGALGLQAQIPREKRELERKQLKEAKEKRRKDRKLKQDMWDGSVGRCAMDQEG